MDIPTNNDNTYANAVEKENIMKKHKTKEELVEKIKAIMRRYFECDDNGNPNPTFDEYYTAQEVVDDIKDLVGEI